MSVDRTKRIVDTHAADVVANQVADLLAQLASATSLNAKKAIRRKLRTREYYISRQHTATTVTTMTDNATPVTPVADAPNAPTATKRKRKGK